MFDLLQQTKDAPDMTTPRERTRDAMLKQIRELKARGLGIVEIAGKLMISASLVHYYSRPKTGEKICPRCCRKFEKEKATPPTVK